MTKVNAKRLAILIVVALSILAIEIGLIVGIYYYISHNNNNNINDIMSTVGENIINYFNFKIEGAKYIVAKNAAFFRIHGIYLSSENYTDLIQNDISPSKGNVESYLWIPKISNSTIDSYQNYCRKYVIENCMIKQLYYFNRTQILFDQVHGRDYYYPLIFAEPKFPEREESILIGFDLNSNNITKSIISIANSSNNVSVTYRINLIQPLDNPNSHGIIMNYPSFVDPKNFDANNIFGYSSALIRVGDILDETFKYVNFDINRQDIDMFVFDITIDDYVNIKKNNISLLYKENKKEYENIWFFTDINTQFGTIYFNYQIANRQWIFYFKYSDNFIIKNNTNLLIIIPSAMAGTFFLTDIIIVILYNYYNSLKQKTILEEKKSTIATQMLGYVNHEIRNPLNVIKGLVQFTLKNIKDLDKKDSSPINIDKMMFDTIVSDLSTVSGSCNMLEHIVTDILDIHKLDSGKLELNNKIIDVKDFMKDIIKTVSQKIDEKQTIQLYTVYDPNIDQLYFDPYRMKQILLNFLTNAIKFTTNGSITIKIEEVDEKIIFSVKDTGRGIRDEAKNKIFQPFNQSNPEDSSRYGGIGLGLHLCKMLAERMGGNIQFQSTFGQGSIFWIDYPKNSFNIPNVIDNHSIEV